MRRIYVVTARFRATPSEELRAEYADPSAAHEFALRLRSSGYIGVVITPVTK